MSQMVQEFHFVQKCSWNFNVIMLKFSNANIFTGNFILSRNAQGISFCPEMLREFHFVQKCSGNFILSRNAQEISFCPQIVREFHFG